MPHADAGPAGIAAPERNSRAFPDVAGITADSGGRYAWTLPFALLSFSFLAPPPTSVPMQVATWMLLPSGTAAGTWTALVLAVAGTAAYAVAGPGR
ncbi:hypothetical protein [Streptomyces prasinus]|uniref:hypothetical protein n=1 Tax=Streptomyces prasinus TaxID=67345 RepID=UPI000B04460E|nr:hypothetical protein [Streptomyces prasinus]